MRHSAKLLQVYVELRDIIGDAMAAGELLDMAERLLDLTGRRDLIDRCGRIDETSFGAVPIDSTKPIWRTFWILSALTIIELTIGLIIYNIHKGENPNASLVLAFKGMVCILTMAKAYYIVSVFMHLGSEVRNMIMTIVVPLGLFVWFIAAFLWDGNSWKNLRNKYNGIKVTPTEQVAPASIKKGEKD